MSTLPTGDLLNREVGILEFNARVLAQAADPGVPLMERLKFICIVSSNLDEFFEIRVAGLKEQMRDNASALTPDGLSVQQAFGVVTERVRQLVAQQYAMLQDEILPLLEKEGVFFHMTTNWNEAQRAWCRGFFQRELVPILTPMALDPAHPFPRVLNKSLNFIIELSGKDAFGREAELAIVQAPRALPRLVQMPPELSGYPYGFVLLSSFMQGFVHELFPQIDVHGCYQFRVTRNSDLFVSEDEITDLREALQGELSTRHFGDAVRLEIAHDISPALARRLQQEFGLSEADCYRVKGPVNLVRLLQVPDLVDRPMLKYPPHAPAAVKAVAASSSIFDAIRQGDILMHHPYESFMPVLELLQQAARDPDVVAIKQTVYRTGNESPVMEALIKAARNGKEVTVVVELLARFDEETNINWADQLESAGAHVVYGVVGHKCHAKMLLVVRREAAGGKAKTVKLRRYAHLGTGNYHPKTARLYTDFGLMTADEAICEDVHHVFQLLTGTGAQVKLHHLWHSPFTMHANLIEHIRAEARRPRRQARAHHRQDERAAGADHHRRALQGLARGRQDRPDRARRVRAQGRRAGAVGTHQRALARRALPGASPRLLLPCRRRGSRLSVQRRLDGPQPVPPRRGRLPGARSQAEGARDPRKPAGAPARQRLGLGDAAERLVRAAPDQGQARAREPDGSAEPLLAASRRGRGNGRRRRSGHRDRAAAQAARGNLRGLTAPTRQQKTHARTACVFA